MLNEHNKSINLIYDFIFYLIHYLSFIVITVIHCVLTNEENRTRVPKLQWTLNTLRKET